MKLFRKWHSFKVGKCKIAIYEKRQRYSGIGYELGCGHDIVEICHVLYINGVEKKKVTVKYMVRFS